MSEHAKINFVILFAVAMALVWTVVILHLSGTAALQGYHEQQRGKAAMVAGVLSEFVIQTRLADIWDKDYVRVATNTWKTSYSQHDVLYRLSNKLLRSVDGDQTVQWIAVVDSGGFVSWSWSRGTSLGIQAGTICADLPSGPYTVIVPIYHSADVQWGSIVMGYTTQPLVQQEAVKSHAITALLLIATLVSGLWMPVRRRFWRR